MADELCSADNFSVTLTDHGVCYTFNRHDENGKVIDVTNSGNKYIASSLHLYDEI